MLQKKQLFIAATMSATMIVVMAVAAVILAGLYAEAAPAQAQTEAAPAAQTASAPARTITVVGEGKVKSRPDVAQANIGVEVLGSDIKQASQDASDTMEALLAALKAAQVADKDIQTSYFNVWVERPYTPQGTPSTEVLYHVNNNVTVTIRDLASVAAILGKAIESGANTINSVTFNVADPSTLRSEARKKAVENALAEAQELAVLNGVKVGEVVSVSEVISGGAYYVSEAASFDGMGGGGGPISPGDVEIAVQLQVTYAIR